MVVAVVITATAFIVSIGVMTASLPIRAKMTCFEGMFMSRFWLVGVDGVPGSMLRCITLRIFFATSGDSDSHCISALAGSATKTVKPKP